MDVVRSWFASMGVLLAAGVAAAQPSDAPTMEASRLEAHDAALLGKCKDVSAIAEQVNATDPAYYANVFLRDAVIASCNEGVGGAPLPPPTVPPQSVTAAPAPGAEPMPVTLKGWHLSDTGRGVLGMFAGIGIGAIFGMGAAMVGIEASDDEVTAVIVGQIGASAGLALGITLVGNHKGGHGSFATSFGLALAGSAASWIFALRGAHTDVDAALFGLSFVALPITGAMTGYWTTHEHTGKTITVVPTGNGISVIGRF
jgi:hypothetical protein